MLRIVGIVLALPVVLALALIGCLHTDAGQQQLREAIVERANERLHGSLEIGSLSFSLGDGVSLSEVRLRDPSGAPALSVASLEAAPDWWTLASGAPVIERLAVDGVTLHVVQDEDGSNLRRIFRKRPEPETESEPREERSLRIEQLHVGEVDVTLEKPDGTVLSVENFGLEAKVAARPAERTATVSVPEIGASLALRKPDGLEVALEDLSTSLSVDVVEGRGTARLGETEAKLRVTKGIVFERKTDLRLGGFDVDLEPGKLEAGLEALMIGALAIESLEVTGGLSEGRLAGRQDAQMLGLRIDPDHLNELAGREVLTSGVALSLGIAGPPEALELQMALRSAGGDLDLSGRADVSDPEAPRYELTLLASDIAPRRLLASEKVPPVRLEELRLGLRGSGRTKDALDVTGELFVGPIEAEGHRIEAVHAAVGFSAGVLEIAPLRIDAYEQTALLRARYDTAQRYVKAHLTARGDVGRALQELREAGVGVKTRVPLRALVLREGVITVDLEGPIDGRLDADVAIDRLPVAGGLVVADLHAGLRRTPPGAERPVDLEDLEGFVAIHGVDVGRALALRGKKLEGMDARLSGRVDVRGAPEAPRVDYRLGLRGAPTDRDDPARWQATVRGHATERDLVARLRVDGRREGAEERLLSADVHLPLHIDDDRRGVSPHRPMKLELTVPERRTSELLAYAPARLSTDPETGQPRDIPEGAVSARVDVEGTPAAPEGTLEVDALAPLLGEASQRIVLDGTITPEAPPDYAPAVVVRSDLEAWLDVREERAANGAITVELSRSPLLPGPRELSWSLDLDVPERELGNLPVELAAVSSGTVGASIHLRGNREDLRGTVALSVDDLVARDKGPLDVTLDVGIAEQTSVEVGVGSGEDELVTLDAEVARSGAGLLAALRRKEQPMVERLGDPELNATLALPRKPIAAYAALSPALASLPGEIEGRIELGGDLSLPVAGGAITYDGFETASGKPGRVQVSLDAGPSTLRANVDLGSPDGGEVPVPIAVEVPRGAIGPYRRAKKCWSTCEDACGDCADDALLPVTAEIAASEVDLRDLVPRVALEDRPVALAGRLSWSLDGRVVLDPRPRYEDGVRLPPLSPDSRLDGELRLEDGVVGLVGTKRAYHDVTLRLRHDENGVWLDELSAEESDREKAHRRLEIEAALALNRFRPGALEAHLHTTDWLVFGGQLGKADAPRGSLSAAIDVEGDLGPRIKKVDVEVADLELLVPNRFRRAHQPEVTHLGDLVYLEEGEEPGVLPVPKEEPKEEPEAPEPSDGAEQVAAKQDGPPGGLDVHVSIPEPIHLLKYPMNLYAKGAIDVRVRDGDRAVEGKLAMTDGDLALGGRKHALQRGEVIFDEDCPGGCLDLLFGRKEHNATLRDISKASGGQLVKIHLEGPLTARRTTLSGAGSPGTLFDLLSVHNVGRQRYLAQPDMPSTVTVEYPQHDNLLLLSYLSVNVPHMLFLDKMAAWSDPYDGRGTETYGRIQHYEAEGYGADGTFRVRAVARPDSAGRSEHELNADYLFSNTPQTAFGVGLSAGDRLGGGPGIFFEWSSED